MKKINKIKAVVFVVAALFLATAITVNAQVPDDYPIDNGAVEEGNEEYGLTWTIDTEGGFLLGGIIGIIPSHEPTGEEIPEFGGGKSSILIIRSIRFPDLSLRLRLRGASIMEWIRFDGHYHESTTSVFFEAWLEDGRYASDNFTIGCKWWGKPSPDRLDIDRHGVTITWHDLETYPLEKIHIYAERVVDNFPPEIHDKTFEKYIFDEAEQYITLTENIIK